MVHASDPPTALEDPRIDRVWFAGRFPKDYWTLSAWESSQDIREYMRAMPHGRVMVAFRASMERFDSVRWKVTGSAMPLDWQEGLQRLDHEALRTEGESHHD